MIATRVNLEKRKKKKGKRNYIRYAKTLVKNELPGRNCAYPPRPSLGIYYIVMGSQEFLCTDFCHFMFGKINC